MSQTTFCILYIGFLLPFALLLNKIGICLKDIYIPIREEMGIFAYYFGILYQRV